MKKAIFYFSGTGNGIAIAKELANRVGECEVLSIAKFMLNPNNYNLNDLELAGVITPVYGYGAPDLVEKFYIKLAKVPYTFVLANFGTNPGYSVKRLGKLIAKAGGKMNAEFYLKMPENFIPIFNTPKDDEVSHLLGIADSRFAEIANIIISKTNHADKNPTSFAIKLLAFGTRAVSAWGFSFLDYGFSLDKEKCTSCSICEKVCPVKNIEMKNNHPKWKHNCAFCISCLVNCPSNAIDLWRSKGQKRYAHPKTKLNDFIQDKIK